MDNKVYANIEESTYFTDMYGYRLYFSSKVYMNKFKNRIEKYIKDERIKLKNKYKVSNITNNFLVLSLYIKIETRGFRVYLTCDGRCGRRLKYEEVIKNE